MAAPDYNLRSFDLAQSRDRSTIIDQGTRINGVEVKEVPAGAAVFLHFGSGRDPYPIVTGDAWEISADGPDGCPVPLDEGLYMTNSAGAGTVTLMISFGLVAGGVRRVA
jgi:hypothetical protein